MTSRELEMQDLCEEIAELASHIASATARWLKLLGRLDAEGGWGDGYETTEHWLSWRCGMTLGTARDHVRVARRLRERPLVQEAFERGELSYSKVRALMRLDGDFDEEQMLHYARYASAAQLETIVRGCCRCVAVEEGAERQFAERSFSWSYDADGSVALRGRLPAEQGALVVRALEAARDELGPPPKELGEDEHWTMREATHSAEARRADALIAVAQEGEPLPAEAARQLSCDASLLYAFERNGQTVKLGRKTRTISPALRRALRMRDKGCAFPGCCQRHHTDAHHIEPWANGGKTDLDNCVQLCRYHHTLIHKGLFKVRREASGFTWFKADGTRLPQAPRLPRGDCTTVRSAGSASERTSWSLYPPSATPRGADLGWSVTSLLESRAERRKE